MRSQHRRLLVVLGEGGAHGGIAVDFDLAPEGADVVEQIVYLLLERVDMRGHLLEPRVCQSRRVFGCDKAIYLLFALFEVVAAVGRVLAVEVEVPAALAGRLAVAFDLPAFALIAGNGDVAVALRPGLGWRILALPLHIVVGVLQRADGVTRVGSVCRRRGAHG